MRNNTLSEGKTRSQTYGGTQHLQQKSSFFGGRLSAPQSTLVRRSRRSGSKCRAVAENGVTDPILLRVARGEGEQTRACTIDSPFAY